MPVILLLLQAAYDQNRAEPNPKLAGVLVGMAIVWFLFALVTDPHVARRLSWLGGWVPLIPERGQDPISLREQLAREKEERQAASELAYRFWLSDSALKYAGTDEMPRQVLKDCFLPEGEEATDALLKLMNAAAATFKVHPWIVGAFIENPTAEFCQRLRNIADTAGTDIPVAVAVEWIGRYNRMLRLVIEATREDPAFAAGGAYRQWMEKHRLLRSNLKAMRNHDALRAVEDREIILSLHDDTLLPSPEGDA